MSRLMNQEKAGYFPLPPAIGDLINTYFQATGPGRVLDPCSGEGAWLLQVCQARPPLTPYAVELNQERAQATLEKVNAHLGRSDRTHVIQGDFVNLRAPKEAFTLILDNPPYMFTEDRDLGRAEYQWLRDTRPLLQPHGLHVWVVPHHMLRHTRSLEYLASWYHDLRVLRFTDEYYPRFKQIVVFGVRNARSLQPDRALMDTLRGYYELGEDLPVITAQDAPVYTLPEQLLPEERMSFHGLFIDEREAAAEARFVGFEASDTYARLLQPTADSRHVLRPLTPMKKGHLTGIIAAGHINNRVVKNGGNPVLIKGQSSKAKRVTSQREERDKGHVEKTFYTEQPQTTLVTIAQDGTITNYAGAELNGFLRRNIRDLAQEVQAAYPPTYTFDLGRYRPVLNALNLQRRIPIVNKPGLIPAQKHAAAAVATRLETENDAVIVGEMGTGKTLMGIAAAACLHSYRRTLRHFIVLCPPHLVEKWIREIKITWPAAQAMALYTIADVDRFFAAEGPIFGVLKETSARAGSGWHHAYDFCGPTATDLRTKRQKPKILRAPRLAQTPDMLQQQGVRVKPDKLATYWSLRGVRCPVCGRQQKDRDVMATHAYFVSGKRSCQGCGSPLYQDAAPTRAAQKPFWLGGAHADHKAKYPLASYILRRYKRKLGLLIADEVHQFKGADSDRGYAFGRLAAAAKKVLALTGTIYGGKASTLFHLLHRFNADTRRFFTDTAKTGRSRLMWQRWVELFGILQEIESEYFDENGKSSGNRKSRVQVKELPGGSPAMLPYLLNAGVFVSLRDMGYALPEYEEIPITLPMTPLMTARYKRMEADLREELRKRLQVGDKSLLGAYLTALLYYPDSPWRTKIVTAPNGSEITRARAIDEPVGSFPKERRIVEVIQQELAEGRRCVLLCQQTNTLDITRQWQDLLQQHHIQAAILKVDAAKREAWIQKQHERGTQVIITHPKRIETGLDLIDFPTIIWMGQEFSVYTVLQASRRAWRIGQTQKCKVYHFAYENTLQEQALKLIAAKVAATMRINGDDIPEDSIAELDEINSGDIVTQLAKLIVEAEEPEAVDREERMQAINAAYEQAQQALAAGQSIADEFFAHCVDRDQLKAEYRRLSKRFHPDSQAVADEAADQLETLADLFKREAAALFDEQGFLGDLDMSQDWTEEPEPEPAVMEAVALPAPPEKDLQTWDELRRIVRGDPKPQRRRVTPPPQVMVQQLSLFG